MIKRLLTLFLLIGFLSQMYSSITVHNHGPYPIEFLYSVKGPDGVRWSQVDLKSWETKKDIKPYGATRLVALDYLDRFVVKYEGREAVNKPLNNIDVLSNIEVWITHLGGAMYKLDWTKK